VGTAAVNDPVVFGGRLVADDIETGRGCPAFERWRSRRRAGGFRKNTLPLGFKLPNPLVYRGKIVRGTPRLYSAQIGRRCTQTSLVVN
jgi:hypothetical protein